MARLLDPFLVPPSPDGGGTPLLALAPMQDVTDLPFWRLIARYGGADVYFTEYFRVHADSRLEKWILRSIDENPTGRPAVAQMIGNDIPSLVRSAKELQHHPVAAIDLNLGCPAPVVYKKCAGGGLLRDLPRVDRILGALREAVEPPVRFTVKTRVGFDAADALGPLLPMLARHGVDLVTVHGRTVAGMYRTPVRYDLIAEAADTLSCPVLANGNIDSPATAARVLRDTGAHGLMIGRGAIRNPWIFDQIRRHLAGLPIPYPTGLQVLAYIDDLYEAVCAPDIRESQQVQKMKKYLNFIGLGVEPTGAFLHAIRRAETRSEFFRLCAEHLSHDDPMPLVPFEIPLAPQDVLACETA
jgi:tRNA-dihydrouridine synthase B